MISAVEWVPAGVADPNPKKYELSAAELELIAMMENQNIEDSEEPQQPEKEVKQSKNKNEKSKLPKIENNLPADLRMDEYSSDEDENDAVRGTALGHLLVDDVEESEPEEEEEKPEDGEKTKDYDMDSDSDGDSDDDLADVPDTREFEPLDPEGFTNLGLSNVGTNAPAYMQNDDDEDDGSEAEDVQIQADDAIIVVAKTDEDFASLEVHVYEQRTGNLFVHHDIPLPAFPLCLAHGDISPTGLAGNYCAVGTFGPGIEVWNLDVLNALEPSCILGGEDTTMTDDLMRHNMMGAAEKKNKPFNFNQQGPHLKAGSHTDAVMALSWNKVHRQVLASGSADCTVKLWDITHSSTDQCNAGTYNHHKDKVQSVLWHPKEGTLLATGSYDRTVALVDARSQENIRKVKIPADCETLAWDPFSPQYLSAASEDGTITCWDVRKFSDKTPLWSLVANEYGGVSDMAYNPHVPGMLATCAVDKTVTLWDTYNATDNANTGPPQACGTKDMQVGKLYAVNFYPSSPWLLGTGGAGKEVAIWDMTREAPIQKRFGSRVNVNMNATGTAVVAVEEPADDPSNKQEAFDAMMSATNSADAETTIVEENSKSKKKKSGNKKKKKVHRAGGQ